MASPAVWRALSRTLAIPSRRVVSGSGVVAPSVAAFANFSTSTSAWNQTSQPVSQTSASTPASEPVRAKRPSGGYVDDTNSYDPEHLYPSQGQFVPSSTDVPPGLERPIPLSVAINDYAPFKHPLTHGHKVAEIQLRSFTTKNLEFYADFLLRVAFYLKIPVKGVTPLPSRTERWTVIRSPFAHAKSKENFERITHRRVIKLYDANPDVVQVCLATAREYSIAGVGIKATLYNRESLDVVENLETPPSDLSLHRPLAVENVDLGAAENEVARAVLDILEDPKFKRYLSDSPEGESPEEAEVTTSAKADAEGKEKAATKDKAATKKAKKPSKN